MDVKNSQGVITKGKYFDLTRELKRAMEHKIDGNINCSWSTWNDPQMLVERTRGTGNQKNRDHPDHSTIKIS